MATVKRIHHLDIVVRDLDRAIEKYRAILDQEPLGRESLPERGIELARFRLGETWLILVQPVCEDSPVAEFLHHRGEGFFHIAYEVESVEDVGRSLAEQGIGVINEKPRHGVEGWKLVDLDIADTLGVMTQMVDQRPDQQFESSRRFSPSTH